MRVYICGPITNNPEYKADFARAVGALEDMGHAPVNPAGLDLVVGAQAGMSHAEYMDICRHLMDKCEAIYLVKGWQDSTGAKQELKEWLERIGGRVMVE